MPDVRREQQLSELREKIAGIEKRPLLADGAALLGPAAGQQPACLEAPGGLLQEIFADDPRSGGASLGFALAMARGLFNETRSAVLFLQLAHDGNVAGLPYGPGLMSFGFAPEKLIIARLATPVELLWAVEEAVACRAVAAVIAEVQGAPKTLDFTASRRLSLRAAGSGASVFLMRYGLERQASAARLRWCISPASSQAPPFDDQAPGRARWHVSLEKGRLRASLMKAGLELWLDWTEHGFIPAAEPGEESRRRHIGAAALHGTQLAALGDRMSEAG
jgi:protein ImuA